ncbi:HK97 family phage prohead protease [Dyadobacter chenwenxiniae]|uniref:HK97 family phage prohead protease n=1 Tax=Dyadobacter chenwenxiniae TaxID=2906456 RepID=A0A9X1PF17_9BACT|nr:HK97 family phage prohead protease [Dyadobacter chenwenxiniae]MCF0060127.1 HK97 family phage prohead protease [Dyadobacter chenwenxiniae]UON85865.1 HK97 family phage prohead protease [Dyadobacter chenwenxiniae]
METRVLPQEFSEVRAIQNEEGVWHIPGKGIVFNQRSRKIGWFHEIIDSRALEGARIDDAISCYNHNMNHILGSVRNKTVSYNITSDYLEYDILPPDNQTTRDIVIAPIVRRDVTGSSFMFNAVQKGGDEWVQEADGIIVRYVKKIEEVYEFGPVSMPAYMNTTTDVAKRSFDDFIKENKQQEIQYRSQFARMKVALLR